MVGLPPLRRRTGPEPELSEISSVRRRGDRVGLERGAGVLADIPGQLQARSRGGVLTGEIWLMCCLVSSVRERSISPLEERLGRRRGALGDCFLSGVKPSQQSLRPSGPGSTSPRSSSEICLHFIVAETNSSKSYSYIEIFLRVLPKIYDIIN